MISRRRRTEALIESDRSVALELASRVAEELDVAEVTHPHQGLVMCEVRETARNSRFNLGEALMTESRVRIGETEGLGVVLGSDDELARALAIIDAAFGVEPAPTCLPGIETSIENAAAEVSSRREREWKALAASRVSFDTMGGQDMSVQGVVR
ncbi:MAG: phosphonate C-P lyase system protein PhnG [Coriobacteriales bacterium]|jgi:alpha-D-ribose 1-methylphosphonate 5-triphosphate synthase subunit PhnG